MKNGNKIILQAVEIYKKDAINYALSPNANALHLRNFLKLPTTLEK